MLVEETPNGCQRRVQRLRVRPGLGPSGGRRHQPRTADVAPRGTGRLPENEADVWARGLRPGGLYPLGTGNHIRPERCAELRRTGHDRPTTDPETKVRRNPRRGSWSAEFIRRRWSHRTRADHHSADITRLTVMVKARGGIRAAGRGDRGKAVGFWGGMTEQERGGGAGQVCGRRTCQRHLLHEDGQRLRRRGQASPHRSGTRGGAVVGGRRLRGSRGPAPSRPALGDILRKGAVYRGRWGAWPTEGWLPGFAARCLVECGATTGRRYGRQRGFQRRVDLE